MLNVSTDDRVGHAGVGELAALGRDPIPLR
jgi:hypothetical protein